MSALVAILNLALILLPVMMCAKRWHCVKNKLFWSSFFVHAVAGATVGLVYKYYYEANDTWFFFENASKVADIGFDNFSVYVKILFDFSENQNSVIQTEDFRSMIFIKLVSLACFVSKNNYWIATAYFSLFSFLSSWFLFRRITSSFPESERAATLAFLFFPSIVFWSSGIEKETLTLGALYIIVGNFLPLLKGETMNSNFWWTTVLSTLILWVLKYYWAAVFFISALAILPAQLLSKRYQFFKQNQFLTYIFSFVVLGIASTFLHPNFYIGRFLEVIVANHQEFLIKSNPDNLIHFSDLSPTIWSFLINAPWALISGFFRPFLGEGLGFLGFAASIENVFILVLFIVFFVSHLRKKKTVHILFLATMSYCVVLSVFLALSTPNLGTLSRYRVGFLPFLIFLMAYKNPVFNFIEKKLSRKD